MTGFSKFLFVISGSLLALGLCIYLSSDSGSFISDWFSTIIRFPKIKYPSFIRNYVCDGLWSIALFLSLVAVLGLGKVQILLSIVISTVFCVLIESSQSFGYIKGTFDYFDMLIEIGTILFVSLLLFKRRKRYEKN